MDAPHHCPDCRRVHADRLLGRVCDAIGCPALHSTGAGRRRDVTRKRLVALGTGALGNRPDDPYGIASRRCGRRLRSGDPVAIAMARNAAVAGHGHASGNADRCDRAADPDLRTDAVDCAIDMRVPRDLLSDHAEHATRPEERRPASC